MDALAAAVGIFMTTADVRDVQTAMIWLSGSLHAATPAAAGGGVLLGAAGALILFCTARAADVWRCWAIVLPSVLACVCPSSRYCVSSPPCC